jgi:glyoxylate/hydroxypyruvate reductase A
MHRTTLAIFARRHDLSFLKPMLEAADPQLDVVVWPDPRFREAEVATGWETPPGLYEEMPRLRLVHGIAAGVDNITAGLDPARARVCRVVDPNLRDGMLQFVLWSVLYFHRRFDLALANQARREWNRPPQMPASGCRVGFMGLGELGGFIAGALASLGYPVKGWSRGPKAIDGVETFSGEQGLAPFLAATDVLVCLLPLTAATRGILAKPLFDQLPAGAALVHCGRGEHLVEQDLHDAVSSGRLRGAVIDVFEQEPAPPDHPFWTTPGIVVTPHMASMASFETVVAQIARNVARLRAGEPLLNEVDLALGY